ncbi:hypothetical protein GCM10023189_37370 [Nibrella saemangeumensis]|uniref:VWFA domain-containing protein n=1 Tax=Nibrella saemangeumensis TaxID=1084526 RepID=A0ABP8N997_9BACT
MQTFLRSILIALSCGLVQAQSPQPPLNRYMAFVNQSVDVWTSRLQMLRNYQDAVSLYRQNPDRLLRLSSSGPLEEYYYQQALTSTGLAPADKQRLTTGTQALWQLLTKLDQTAKGLETYVRLKDYQRDNLQQSDALIGQMQVLFGQFSHERESFAQQVRQVYRRHQPYQPADPYLYTENEMEQVLRSQQQLLDALTYTLNEDSPAAWPVEAVQQSMLADEKLLADFGKAQAKIANPASDMVKSFKTAIQTLQDVKRRAINEYTYAARQSARHGNAVYLSLLQYVNQDLLASHQAFVNYSRTARQLLDYPKYPPVFVLEGTPAAGPTLSRTPPFADKPLVTINPKPAAAPVDRPTMQALNGYIDFTNESLRQMHQLQVLLRNFQSSAEYYRDPTRAQKRANLTYSHESFKVPSADYQLLINSSRTIPEPYRTAINIQAEVLLNMLNEMNGLSTELIAYTADKQYLQDQLQRSDLILDRYAYLFDLFDQKKEQLYRDVRRIYERYPVANLASAWNKAGKALLQAMDDNKTVLFGVKAYLKNETGQLPVTTPIEADSRRLISEEYENLKGLQRLGRSNGLCPYSPYEDIAENSMKFAEMAKDTRPASTPSTPHQYQFFYYFFNNQFVYQYNKFVELAKEPLLKVVNQPDIFVLRRATALASASPSPNPADQPTQTMATTTKPVAPPTGQPSPTQPVNQSTTQPLNTTTLKRDTIYVERTRVDTVYVGRPGQPEVNRTLKGFAANNMVLLLDVSASMDSPVKLPLLKQSIKSLLSLLRPEDQIAVVVYSGKAKVVLPPTSGANIDEIVRAINTLQSRGDTDGNEGLKLAYKVANKNYIRAGNNRIVLASDGEFPVSDEVLQLISENTRQDIYLSVFTFGINPKIGLSLKRLSELGKGTYTHVTRENADLQLILEAQNKPLPQK